MQCCSGFHHKEIRCPPGGLMPLFSFPFWRNTACCPAQFRIAFSSCKVNNWHEVPQAGCWITACPCIVGCGSIVGILKAHGWMFPLLWSINSPFTSSTVKFCTFVILLCLRFCILRAVHLCGRLLFFYLRWFLRLANKRFCLWFKNLPAFLPFHELVK